MMKRKVVLLTVISAVFCHMIMAQSLKLIPKVGVNLATYSFSDDLKKSDGIQSVNSVMVFSFGVGLDAKLKDNLSLQPEINYNQTGFNLEIKQGGITVKTDYKFNTLQVPVLLKYSFGGSETIRMSILAGPYYSYNLGGSGKSDITSSGGSTTSIKGDLIWGTRPANYNGTDGYISEDEANRGDFGAIFGIAGSISVGPGALYVEARYTKGFTNFTKMVSGVSDLSSTSQIIGFQVGYAIPLGR